MIQSLSAKSIWGFPGLFGSGLFGGGSHGGYQPWLWARRGGDLHPSGTTTPTPGQAFERINTFEITPSTAEITDDPAWELDENADLQPVSF